MFTPADDVYEDYLDGSGRALIARAGVPMPWARAQMLGLVEGDAPAGDIYHYANGVWETEAEPDAIVSEEVHDSAGAVVARSKSPQKAKGQ